MRICNVRAEHLWLHLIGSLIVNGDAVSPRQCFIRNLSSIVYWQNEHNQIVCDQKVPSKQKMVR